MTKILACAAVALLAVGCNNNSSPTDPSQVSIEFTTTEIIVGTGAEVAAGSTATVTYTGWLYNQAGTDSKGAQFGSSSDPGAGPLQLVVGGGQFLRGFEQGILGMRLGGKRRVYIPSNLGYGSRGSPDGVIPPNAALVFEIELLTLT